MLEGIAIKVTLDTLQLGHAFPEVHLELICGLYLRESETVGPCNYIINQKGGLGRGIGWLVISQVKRKWRYCCL